MISIIIVNYYVKKELFVCLRSIYQAKPKTKFEIIVVDNDEKKTIVKDLKKTFPKVRYLKNINRGFGQGNNVGAKFAKGDYLFFLNPDTKLVAGCIDTLTTYLDKNKNCGIAAPMLYDMNEKMVALQGARKLTPISAIFSFSILSKLLPNNFIAKKYWYLNQWNKKSVQEVESIPGTAFVIRKEIYEKVGGFDENFFLYFEEQDLCKRVIELGWKIAMLPRAKVLHILGSSTKKATRDMSLVFRQSRFYYFKKHFGLLNALLTELVMRMGKYELLLIVILGLGIFLRLAGIDKSMQFIGDQGWFYLSARDMLLQGTIPLVGIASSHPWLHQGAFWTYLLAGWLWFFHFNPLAGAYLSCTLDAMAIMAIYLLGGRFFTKTTGILAALFYATSPLVIANIRMPYHTSPIPLFVILFFYSLMWWINNKKYAFPVVIFFLGVLYNLEIATFLFSIITGLFLCFGLWQKKHWAQIFNKKIIFLAVLGFLIPMLSMLLYDLSHGFAQTLKFLAWLGYKILIIFGYSAINQPTSIPMQTMLNFVDLSYTKLIYPSNGFFAFFLFSLSIVVAVRAVYQQRNINFVSLFLSTIILVLGLFMIRVPSDAYLPMLFPSIILITAYVLQNLLKIKQTIFLIYGLIFVLVMGNLVFLIANNYTFTGINSFQERLTAAKKIVKEAGEKEYNLKGRGVGSQFASFTMNYEYLTWWLGHGPSKDKQGLVFTVSEDAKGINVLKETNKL